MSTRQYGPARITTNLDAVIQKYQGTTYPTRIFGSVWTEVEYAIFLEFGTSRMAPRAMIRRSLPAIKAYMESEWKKLRTLPTPLELQALVDRVLVYARAEIAQNTPVKSGRLRDSWKVNKAKME
jgi:hypothetical protein